MFLSFKISDIYSQADATNDAKKKCKPQKMAEERNRRGFIRKWRR